MRFFYLALLLILVPAVSAAHLEMPLLAVQQSGENLTGSIAHLQLDTKPGSGRVFLDTFPFTKTDTQMSTRLAQRMACDFLEAGCAGYDFFYTIRANSTIIGGPSASAAVGVITVAALDGLSVDQDVAITGTLTSGNIIGPVGGIKEKIEAAADHGIDQVLIPIGKGEITEDNETIDLIGYGEDLGVEVREVQTLNQAVSIITGRDYPRETGPLQISQDYTETMQELAAMLCNRTDKLMLMYNMKAGVNDEEVDEDILNLTRQSDDAYKDLQFYSAASYCFNANVQIQYQINKLDPSQDEEVQDRIINLTAELDKVRHDVAQEQVTTITDLQTYMVVRERIREAEQSLDDLRNSNQTNSTYYLMAYTKERMYSALSWSRFFDNDGEEYNLDSDTLKSSCVEKLADAEETYRYTSLYFPTMTGSAEDEYAAALKEYHEGNYALCLFKASKAKAMSNVLMSVIGVDEDSMDDMIKLKLDVARSVISGQAGEGRFPIVGYSYYEYANSLIESNKYTSLLYAEYALELSNLDLFFNKQTGYDIRIEGVPQYLLGLVTGIIITLLIVMIAKTQQNTRDERFAGKKR